MNIFQHYVILIIGDFMKEIYYFYIYLGLFVLMTLVTFVLYGWDKKKAIDGKWRTKEKTLLLSSFLLGSVGGLMGMYLRRHKNNKWYFVVVNWGSLLIHLAGLGLLIYYVVIPTL